ncbi:hypothetical protein [Streptomyces harbinensis]|uniref:hypothetical protein n=1 Tax=Streptomyces harbinensis TaxID=1176198 RepID=UPI0034DE29D2
MPEHQDDLDDDVDTVLERHAARYEEVYGVHPYTTGWEWASAAVAWYEEWAKPADHAYTGGWRPTTDSDRELVTAAVAEGMRLMMCWGTPVGDLRLYVMSQELGTRLRSPHYPEPGEEPGWPAPTGPHAAAWWRWVELERTDRTVSRRVVRWAGRVHAALEVTRQVHWDPWGVRRLADVAALLGITWVPVADPARYVTAPAPTCQCGGEARTIMLVQSSI